jgi:uncharacterized protein Veg
MKGKNTMKAILVIKKATIATVAAVLMSAYALTAQVSAIPYTSTHPGTNYPAFNVFTGVPNEGDESDFLRGKEETNPAASTTDVQSACENGTRYRLRVYVHNSANQTLNASGQGIARDTKVRVALPGQGEASSFNFSSVISASNATSVSDTMTIKCANGKKVKLSYVPGSATQFTGHTGTKPLNDSIVTTGAKVGTTEPDGNVLGCFGQRVWVTLVVKVEEVKEEPKPVVSAGECKLVDIKAEAGRKVTAKVTGIVNNAEIVGYKIDWGDGTTSNKQEDTHTYAKDGTYTITTSVQVKLHDGTVVWKTADDCVKQVTFKGEQPPKVTKKIVKKKRLPAALPEAGAAGVATAFVGVTTMSTLLYNRFGRRFF